MSRFDTGFRLACYYAATFGAIGINLPFWPVWLADRGLSASEIGVVVAVTYLCRIAVNPVIGWVVDRRGDRRRPMVVLAAAAAGAWALFAFVHGYGAILVLSFVATGLWAGGMPIGESLAMMACAEQRLNYGRIRLWGSLAFIVAATLGGRLLVTTPPKLLVWPIAAGLVLTTLACLRLPDMRAPSARHAPGPALRPLLVSTPFLLFLAATACNNVSHTVYYAFATLHWRAAGIGGDVIGLLWSEGVIAEILLFALSGPVVRVLGPARLLVLAGIAGIVRWTLLALPPTIGLLVVVQLLHAGTFGCAHLGAMHFLGRAVPVSLGVRAQALFSAIAIGLLPGLTSFFAGTLYQRFAGGAFLAMTVASAGALWAAWGLARRWRGELVVSAPSRDS